MKTIILALVLALAGCGPKASRRAPDVLAVPGLRWVTSAEPWHLPRPLFSFAADGDAAILGSRDGWLLRIDLRTGRVVASRQIGKQTTYGLASLGDGRWVGVGLRDDHVLGYVIDENLMTTPIALPDVISKSWRAPDVERLDDGGIVITGEAMPLAIYDPKTWKVRTMLSEDLGWGQLKVRGNVIGALHDGRAYRFDLATSKHTELGDHLWFDVSPTLSAFSRRVDHPVGRESEEVFYAGVNVQETVLPDPVNSFAFDDTGRRLVTTHVGQVWIHDLPSGVVKHRVDLAGNGDDSPYLAAIEDDRAFVIVNDVLRVIELETGAVTPAADPSWGAVTAFTVADDGTVVVVGAAQRWHLENGSVTRTDPFEGLSFWRNDDLAHLLVAYPDRLERRDADGAVTQTWAVDGEAYAVWPGRDGWIGELVPRDAGWDDPNLVIRARGTEVETLFPIEKYRIDDVDPDRGELLINSMGVRHVISADAPTAAHQLLPSPACEDVFGGANLERGGTRASTWSERELAVWDRTTSTLLGSARFDDEIFGVLYVPGRDELLVSLNDHLVLWIPNGEARLVALPGFENGVVSADGHQLALGFHDGRVALVDLDALRAGTPEVSLPGGNVPTSCPTEDPT